MVVNSINFLIFFFAVFVIYYILLSGKKILQNGWLLLSSYFFYGFAEWKMVPLLIMATITFYVIGLLIGKYNDINGQKTSILTTVGVLLGIGVLFYFKYLNFFIESFSSFFDAIGIHTNWSVFHILMPLGISFFTFKLISYVIEVHRRHIEPCRDLVAFATYISFFPTILSGPIDRPKPFLSQLQKARIFDANLVSTGLKRILWGMFIKMCIADRLAVYTDAIFNNFNHHNGTSLLFSSLLYPIQMYADFCGYSEMAIGVGCVLGLKVAENFKRPFFSENIAEYWRRWHISLTGWLTDYVFMPLNIHFRNLEKYGSILAIVITFVLIGFWHGASWTFALFGLYHGLLYIPLIISGAFFKKAKQKRGEWGLPTFRSVIKMLGTFLLVALGLIIFRAATVEDAFMILEKIVCEHGPLYLADLDTVLALGYGSIALFFLAFKDFTDEYMPSRFLFYKNQHIVVRFVSYAITVIMIFSMGVLDSGQFIYFQF